MPVPKWPPSCAVCWTSDAVNDEKQAGPARPALPFHEGTSCVEPSPNKLRRLFSRLNLICAILGAALLFLIAAIICFEVTVRALGGASRLWVIEVSEYALLFITFLGAPYLLEKNAHVLMDLLYNSFVGHTRLLVQGLNAAIGLVACAIITVIGVQVVIEQFQVGVREVTVMRPLSWWITASLPLGTGLMTVQFLDQLVRTFRREVI